MLIRLVAIEIGNKIESIESILYSNISNIGVPKTRTPTPIIDWIELKTSTKKIKIVNSNIQNVKYFFYKFYIG